MVFALSLGEALDHLAETAETQVDRLELQHVLLVHHLLFVDFLTACQIAEVQLAPEDLALVIGAVRFNEQLENGVGAR